MEINLNIHRQFSDHGKQFVLVIGLMIVLLLNNAFAETSETAGFPPEEFQMLPRWCQVRLLSHEAIHNNRNYPPDKIWRENKRYEQLIGKDVYPYVHHFIYALIWVNRYKIQYKSSFVPFDKTNEKDRHHMLQTAIGEFGFIRSYLRPRHNLYLTMLMNEAYLYGELGDYKMAQKRYQEIASIKRKKTNK